MKFSLKILGVLGISFAATLIILTHLFPRVPKEVVAPKAFTPIPDKKIGNKRECHFHGYYQAADDWNEKQMNLSSKDFTIYFTVWNIDSIRIDDAVFSNGYSDITGEGFRMDTRDTTSIMISYFLHNAKVDIPNTALYFTNLDQALMIGIEFDFTNQKIGMIHINSNLVGNRIFWPDPECKQRFSL